MKKRAVIILSIVLASGFSAAEAPPDLQNDNAKINYSVGYQVGSDFKRQKVDLRSEAMSRGIQDALSGSAALMSAKEMRDAMQALGERVAEQKNQQRKMRQASRNNALREEQTFLEKNAKKPGITTTDSGLQYRVIEVGSGIQPKKNDKVLVHYTGKLLDGTVFDSSYDRNGPASFRVDQVIAGWTEALQLMKRGSHWQLFIPSKLAYGSRGAGTKIPPDSMLIFEVELLSVN